MLIKYKNLKFCYKGFNPVKCDVRRRNEKKVRTKVSQICLRKVFKNKDFI